MVDAMTLFWLGICIVILLTAYLDTRSQRLHNEWLERYDARFAEESKYDSCR
jgi:hypothetical protein